jgi:Glycine cleavage H-protein
MIHLTKLRSFIPTPVRRGTAFRHVTEVPLAAAAASTESIDVVRSTAGSWRRCANRPLQPYRFNNRAMEAEQTPRGALPQPLLAPPTTIDRYFSLHAGVGLAARCRSSDDGTAPPLSEHGADTYIARHHNGICVLCLSPEHPVVTRGLGVAAVEFRAGLRAVAGKKKRGGTFLEAAARLAVITCESGERYSVCASVRGMLLEVNAALEESPALVCTAPLTNGYLAVVLPKSSERISCVSDLVLIQGSVAGK